MLIAVALVTFLITVIKCPIDETAEGRRVDLAHSLRVQSITAEKAWWLEHRAVGQSH